MFIKFNKKHLIFKHYLSNELIYIRFNQFRCKQMIISIGMVGGGGGEIPNKVKLQRLGKNIMI